MSFIVASILLKTSAQGDDEDSLEKASAQMKDMKASSKGAASGADVNLADVKAVYVACDAGMGSSAMGAGLLRKGSSSRLTSR